MNALWWTLAWRNLWRNKRRTIITAGSAFFAVFFAVVMQSVTYGVFGKMIEDMARLSTGHVQVQDSLYLAEPTPDHSLELDAERLAAAQRVEGAMAVMPRLEAIVLASSGDRSMPVQVIGIEPTAEDSVNRFTERIRPGGAYFGPPVVDLPEAVVGAALGDQLGLAPGDTLFTIGQGYHGVPAYGRFRVAGLLELGNPELSKRLVYVQLAAAQHAFRMEGRVTGVVCMADPAADLEDVQAELAALFPEHAARLWSDLMPDLEQTLEGKLAGNYIILFILYLIIGFGLFSTVLMMMSERQKEFGILISVGTGRRTLAAMVYLEVALLGLLGVGLGSLAVWPFLEYFDANPVQLRGDLRALHEQYGLEPILPVMIEPFIFLNQAAVVLSMALTVGFYPLRVLKRLDILKASRS
jgi:ABC-type lipoprotein release transport system permease subunit